MIVKLSILIAFSLLLLVPTGYSFADDKEDKKEKKIKTLESECGKKLDKKKLNFEGLMCQAVFELQSQADALVVDITINWIDIVGIPADIADGDDDTHLTEAEVDTFVSNNGFSTEPHTVDTDTQYSGVDFATSEQSCDLGSVVTGIDENGAVTCALDEIGSGGDTSALESRIAFLESRTNNPPTITDFEIDVHTTITDLGVTTEHECVIDYSYTVNDDKRWIALTIEESTEDYPVDPRFSRTTQLESLTFTENISNSFTYDYRNLSSEYRSSDRLTLSVFDGEDTTTITQDFRC
jgi:hypothetical protein